MTTSPTVSLRFSQAIVQACDRLNLVLPARLRSELASFPARVPLPLQDELWESIASASDDPLIGLRIGLEVQVGHLDSAGLLLMSCETLGDGLEALQEYFPIIGAGSVCDLRKQTDGWRVRYLPGYDVHQAIRGEAAIGCSVHLSRWMTGGGVMPLQICLQHAPRGPLERYRMLLGQSPQFRTEDYSLLFAAADLRQPLVQANATMRAYLQQAADQMLASLSAQSLAVQVEALVRHHPQWGKDRIADLLGISGRHLNRRLAEEGSSFKLLRDATLYRMARERLRGNERLREIAKALGFADESSFAKAFRRWTGSSPAQFRERAQAHTE
ncbi:MAG: AraC family transcriptional regulator [Ectothiorhodospiraceae bacterium]|nr:AraC family transcriptional regulator [Ectothiorhodospiraceae bacterium]